MNTIAETIAKRFSENFSSRARLFSSPGRINLIGEHIDYNDGFVMPAAIDKGVFYAVAENGSDEMHFAALDFHEKLSVKLADISALGGWKNYVLSVVNEFMLLDKKISGFDCVFGGDIPRGSGMSSSAAVEGGLAFALNELYNIGLNRVELALLCQRAEHNYPGVQCGIMDQFANMMGKKGQVILLDCRSLAHEYFPLRLEGYKIVLIDSKVHHTLATGEYNIRRKRCEEGMRILKESLDINSFRDIKSVDELDEGKKAMSPEVYDCCKYVVEEIARTQSAARLLQQDDIASFGKLMYATHEGLSKLFKVSCKELDYLVDFTVNNKSVIGSRLMGGGFGGCTINIVETDGVDELIARAKKEYSQHFGINAEAYKVDTSDGAKEVSVD